MPRSKQTFDSLPAFTDAVNRIVREWTPHDAEWYLQPWFRGHADATWPLSPGLYRMTGASGIGADYYSEAQLLESFKLRAPRYLERPPQSDWEWLFIMQHYGLPTRLLDWTESALVALYFAVRDNDETRDAAVWVTNPWWINRQVFGKWDLFAADDPKAEPWRVGLAKRKRARKPAAVVPVYTSIRINAQRGVFTIHGSDPEGLTRLAAAQGPDTCLRQLVLPKGAVATVRQELAIAGISESLIFPELDGLCRELKRFFFDT
jgi:FRG domain-containing protein